MAGRFFSFPFFGHLNSDDLARDRVSASIPNAHAVEDDRQSFPGPLSPDEIMQHVSMPPQPRLEWLTIPP
jgi:hypothetical protein